MEWQKTTFGELKEGDVFCGGILPDGRSGYDVIFMKNTGPLLEGTFTNNETVYRLVLRSPEREALEKMSRLIVKIWDEAPDRASVSDPLVVNFDDMDKAHAIAKAALEVKP